VTDGKPARITAFSKEQGFGRVAVPDEGELVFDASVAACSAEDLVVGAEVLVRTGPGRVPGKQKVVRLWRAGTSPPVDAAAAAAAEVERFASMGAYRFLLPPFWPNDSVNERGPVWTSAAKVNDVERVLLVFVGGAADAKAKVALLAARAAGAPTTRCDTQRLGLRFEGYRFDHGAEVEHLYVLAAHDDLLTAGCRCAAANPEAERLSLLLLTMVGSAVHRRGPPSPSPAKAQATRGGFWRRLLGG
jgi:hypothetical protein